MIDRAAFRSAMAKEGFRRFPPVIRASLLESKSFRETYDLKTDARVAIGSGEITFQRSKLYDAIRRLRANYVGPVELSSNENVTFAITLEGESDSTSIVLREGNREILLSDFSCLAAAADDRQRGIIKALKHRNIDSKDAAMWMDRLATSPLEDDEVDELTQFLHLTPRQIIEAIRNEVKTETSKIAVLVPKEPIYYERLIGKLETSTGLESFTKAEWRNHVVQLLEWDFPLGLRQVILISPHSNLSSNIPIECNKEEVVSQLFQWLTGDGDRFSQVAAVELGLQLLEQIPVLEASIFELVKTILADDPDDSAGRLNLTNRLMIFVDGELARLGMLRDKPPYWRRLAAIAQASLIERELLKVGINSSKFADWATEGRGQIFFLQTLADLRLEPRWLPDFATPQQLRQEFLGRIYSAGMRYQSNIKSSEFREMISGSGIGTVKSALVPPMAYFPGPLEGGILSTEPFPDDLATELRESSSIAPLTESALAGIVNMGLVFKIEDEHARVVADALRRAKYQLRLGTDSNKIFSLVTGLAIVAAVTRAPELANEVRVLARVQRRRAGVELEANSLMRIGLIAAASERDLDKWCSKVGEWFLGIANEDIDRSVARRMRAHLLRLCGLVPGLWRTCSKAEAGFAIVAKMVG